MQQCEHSLVLPSGAYCCRYHLNTSFPDPNGIRIVDLILSLEGTVTSHNPLILDTGAPLSAFLERSVKYALQESRDEVAIKLLVPSCSGYVIRRDMAEFRLYGCQFVREVETFISPGQFVEAPILHHEIKTGESPALGLLIHAAIGAISAHDLSEGGLMNSAEALEEEIQNRLSLEWFSTKPIARKRLALVKPRQDYLFFVTVKDLGIDLIVLDDPGSWIEDESGPYASLRSSFTPFDTNPDSGFCDRLRDAAQQAQVDGILARSDIYFHKIAEVCRNLGLPTASPEAFWIGTDKHAQRKLINSEVKALRVSGVQELRRMLESGAALLPDFPLIVKPTTGSRSQGVSKASNKEDLFRAVEKIQGRILGYEGSKAITADALIEPYVKGPEIDANLVMLDGEVLFSEISDDFPSSADREDSTMERDDFQESMFVYPTKLPPNEQEALRTSLYQAVSRMGFTSGIFHVEARVINSRMQYKIDENDIYKTELEDLASPPAEPPSVFLIEVNARPPAYLGLMTCAYTYGVDYHALWVLNAVGDRDRFKALCRPFRRGPQFTSALVIIQPEKGGTLMSDDPAKALRLTRPDLMDCIPLHREVFKRGDLIPDPRGPWMAYVSSLMVISRTGRKDLLHQVREIRREWKHDIV
ncbi:hypothetical protein FHL15_009933 [Xylaria flabelliformis]|uniref:ATP-grasp domain-containing protein n=1 Tax=Xylaria flabelliformis TaxID=2512241 RepID=A0A553HMQ1_9PEZI|nr:hypothetical protein FHL15_009933 [Xylaria flabelliformis]